MPTLYLRWSLPTLLIVAPAVFAWLLQARAPESYYLIIQEDNWPEWTTVWAFLLAAAGFAVAARQQYREGLRWPWFFTGLAAFCFLVAMEEISWGQRLFSFRPPAYFLQDNFQQELNLHNIMPGPLRQRLLQILILGYGVLLPLTQWAPALKSLVGRVGLVSPAAELAPGFALTFVFYVWYPLDFTGEWVELMFGLAMLFAAALAVFTDHGRGLKRPSILLGLASALSLMLGAASMAVTAAVFSGSSWAGQLAETEIAALVADFNHPRVATRCGVHKRVYTFLREYGQTYLAEGTFAGLTAGGLDEKRARFFLDPWNMPYWVRHQCSKQSGRETIFVYSFGPNRKRDSTQWEIRPDDVGAKIATP